MLNESPPLRRKHYVDGLCSVPVDLVRDPELGVGDKTVALGLAALAFGSEVTARNRAIRDAIGAGGTRGVQEALLNLEAAGWIRRLEPQGCRRTIVLLWRLPDDFRDLAHPELPRRRARTDAPSQLPLFEGGGVAVER